MSLDKLTVRRFLSCFIGSGKTTDMMTALACHLKDGKVCGIVTNGKVVYNHTLKCGLEALGLDYDQYKNQIEFIDIKKVLRYLKPLDLRDNADDTYIKKDPCFVNYRTLGMFDKYDRILICHEAYEYVIRELMGILDAITSEWTGLDD